MPTRKENLRMVLRGDIPQWVPFALNFDQWYYHHKTFGSLPADLQGTGDYIEAMKALECDIFSRNVDSGFRREDRLARWEESKVKTAVGHRRIEAVQTPYGDLRQVYDWQERLSTGHQSEYLVKDWTRDGDGFKWFLEQQEFRWDRQAYAATRERIGEDGMVLVKLGTTPLKVLHQHFGLDGTCYFVMDYHDEAKRLCDLYWSKLKGLVEEVAADGETEAGVLMDNVDTPFYPPGYCKDFWTPYVREAAEIFHKAGKRLFVHACGQLAGLGGEFARAGLDGLEGISPPPLGDWPYAEAKRCHERFIVNGGFSAHEQQAEDEGQLRRYYEGVFAQMQPLDRWIFAASCQTAIQTSWERIKWVRDLVRELGTVKKLKVES